MAEKRMQMYPGTLQPSTFGGAAALADRGQKPRRCGALPEKAERKAGSYETRLKPRAYRGRGWIRQQFCTF
jgi:hypothetical protein